MGCSRDARAAHTRGLWIRAAAAAADAIDDAELAEGTVLDGRYSIEEALGSGTFATTYSVRDARDASAQKCVKVIDLAQLFRTLGSRAGARARREAVEDEVRALRRLTHERVVRMWDLFFETIPPSPGRAAVEVAGIVMQFCPNGHLKQLIRRGGCSPERAAELALQVAEGLEYVHGLPTPRMHCDLKLENVCLDEHHNAVIIDWGASWSMLSTLRSTVAREESRPIVGTPFYFSPERRRNEGFHIQDDVWAWGLVALMLVLGFLEGELFSGESVADALEAIAGHVAEAKRRHPVLGGLIERALRVAKADRPLARDIVHTLRVGPTAVETSSAIGGGGGGAARPDAVEADCLLAIEGLRATRNFAGLARYLTSGLGPVRLRATEELLSAAASKGSDRDAVKVALSSMSGAAVESLRASITAIETDEALLENELRERAAEIALWRGSGDFNALLRVVSTAAGPAGSDEPRDRVERRSLAAETVRKLASEEVWKMWESQADKRVSIESVLGFLADSTEETKSLKRRVETAKEALRRAAAAEAERAAKAEADRRAAAERAAKAEADRRAAAERERTKGVRPQLPTKTLFRYVSRREEGGNGTIETSWGVLREGRAGRRALAGSR